MLIDTHCHLDYLAKENDLDEIILRAKNNGIGKIISISTKVSEFEKLVLPLKEKYDNVFLTVGTHPDNVDCDFFDIDYVLSLCEEKKNKIVGIGETGIDLYRPENPKLNKQIESLEKHFYVAEKTNLPIIFHSRNAENETKSEISRLQNGNIKGVMHCFTGSYDLAKFALDQGFYISFSGIITFKNAKDLQEVAKKIPLDRILLETDAPFLAPVPFRGKQNEPSYLKFIAEFVSDLLEFDYFDFVYQVEKNALLLFDL